MKVYSMQKHIYYIYKESTEELFLLYNFPRNVTFTGISALNFNFEDAQLATWWLKEDLAQKQY